MIKNRNEFDTLIIGGGLSGLACGITLAKTGRRVAIVAAGVSSLQLNGGAMELLGCVDGNEVERPLDAIATLPDQHPYQKIGAERCGTLAREAKQLLADTGIFTEGSAEQNHWRITPIGVTKPAWLSLRGMATSDRPDRLPWRQATLLSLQGFVDFPQHLVAHNLASLGSEVTMREVVVESLCQPRRSASEMRAANLARTIGTGSKLRQLADAINQACRPDEVVLLPAMTGLEDDYPVTLLRRLVHSQLHFVATMPSSVPGTRMANLLRHYFKMLGGVYLAGETVSSAIIDGDKVASVCLAKSPDVPLAARNFVLAAGSLMSGGLLATTDAIIEPLFALDVDIPALGSQSDQDTFIGNQPFMQCGVLTDASLHPLMHGAPLTNLYAIGSVLAGHNPATMGDGTGVDLLTALAVAHHIIQSRQ